MNRLLIAILMLGLAVASWAADTLTIANVTSALNLPLQDGTLECNINAQVPVNVNSTFQTTLNERVNKRVALLMEFIKGEESTLPLLNSIERAMIKAVPKYNSVSGRHHITMDISLIREYESSKLITFRLDLEYYGLDKQRHQATDHITIIKQNGKTLSWSDVIAKKQQGKFAKAAASAMESYFGVRDFINLKAQLKNGATMKPETFPLPEGDVAITRDGFCLAYQAGEIADEDKGLPYCTMSLSSVWSYVSPSAKKVLK